MSFDLFNDDPHPPSGQGATSVMAEAGLRRTRQRVIVGTAASVAVALVAITALRSPDDSRAVVANEPPDQQVIGPITTIPGAPMGTTVESTSTTSRSGVRPSATFPPPPTTTSTTQPVHTGTANLTYSGVLSGPLANAVAVCRPRPYPQLKEIQVNGTLNGTPWVLWVQSYNGEDGVWQVLTGKAGGGTGLEGSGYGQTAEYPATVPGVTNVDWARGATLDVDVTSREGQTPVGTVRVTGTVTCN